MKLAAIIVAIIVAICVGVVALLAVLFTVRMSQIRKTVETAPILVCALGADDLLLDQAERDADVYRRHFSSVTLLEVSTVQELLEAVDAGQFRILHLLSAFTEEGTLVQADGSTNDVAPIFQIGDGKLILVFFAADTPNDRGRIYEVTHQAFSRNRIEHVITSARGEEFAPFLDHLLREYRTKGIMGIAWGNVRPQDLGFAPAPQPDPGPEAVLVIP